MYVAVGCQPCHDEGRSSNYLKNLLPQMICRMSEFGYYENNDKHQLAYQSLEKERGQEIAKHLGEQDPAFKGKKASEMGSCLSCHAVSLPGGGQLSPEELAEGVSCVACHGPYTGWVGLHPNSILVKRRPAAVPAKAAQKDWTTLTREEKERDYGMTNLWDPVRRAETCVACHVGNYIQGKIITHAMYAAGHPPLPSFEAATFSDAQPRHWEYLREKSLTRLRRFVPPPNLRNLEQTQLLVTSGMVTFSESMKLFADQAEADQPNLVVGDWPDLARFDCYACHRELRSPQYRSQQLRSGIGGASQPFHRGFRGPSIAGRRTQSNTARNYDRSCPPLPTWPRVLVPLGLTVAYPDATRRDVRNREFNARVEMLLKALQSRPYGDRKQVAKAARDLADWSDSAREDLKRSAVDSQTAFALLAQLCKLSESDPIDYDSARQIAWAFRIMYYESIPKVLTLDPVIEHALDDLDAELALTLPSAGEQVPIETTLPKRLKIAADFNAGYFRDRFEMIAKRLPEAFPAPAAGH
jgi:hypothetical protein